MIRSNIEFLWGGALVLLFPLSSVVALTKIDKNKDGGPHLILRSNGPAVLDAPITIFAELINHESLAQPFYFVFVDDASPMHQFETKSTQPYMNHTIEYPSKIYEARKYAASVRVYVATSIFSPRKEVGKDSISYSITRQLNGQLVILPQVNNTRGQVVSTLANVVCHAEIYDPEGYLDNNDTAIRYFWFVNDTNYGSTSNATFSNQYGQPGTTRVEALILATIDSRGGTTAPDLGNSKTTAEAVNDIPPHVKFGKFDIRIQARNPMSHVIVDGDVWMKHGRMLDLNVTCDGSGPWSYCWSIRNSDYNVTGNEVCRSPQNLTEICFFQIFWYFRSPGESALLVVLDNGLNHVVKRIGVIVYEVESRIPISLIVFPILSMIVAVVGCISGVFVFMTFKRHTRGLETANFDFSFSPVDDRLEYKTFWERLRDSIMSNLGHPPHDDVSNVSSVSSRSIQGPPVGIHYGTIT